MGHSDSSAHIDDSGCLELAEALAFAAHHHQEQRRSGYPPLPYINHLIKVAVLLMRAGESNQVLLTAAVLHDVVEDTEITVADLAGRFGQEVADIVEELTDDMSLPYAERKRIQVAKAPTLSESAKKIKIADKLCNIEDILAYPVNWSNERKCAYITWSVEVVNRVRGVNASLEAAFDAAVQKGKQQLEGCDETQDN